MPSGSNSLTANNIVIVTSCFPVQKSVLSLNFSWMWQGAIDLLLEVYKQAFNKMGGYIVSTEKVHAESNC